MNTLLDFLIPRPCGGAFHCNEGEVCREYWEVGKFVRPCLNRNLSFQNDLFWPKITGAQFWDHQLRQLCAGNAHYLPMCHLGRLGGCSLLGRSHHNDNLFFFITPGLKNLDSPIYLSITCFGFRHVHMVFDLSSKVDICFETQFSIVPDARCARTRFPVDLLHIPGISLFEMENICSNLCFRISLFEMENICSNLSFRISICEMENICCIYVFLTSGLFAVGVLVLFPSNDVFLKSRSILTAPPPLAILPRPPLPFLGNNPHLPPCSSSWSIHFILPNILRTGSRGSQKKFANRILTALMMGDQNFGPLWAIQVFRGVWATLGQNSGLSP